jgi:predicted ATPase with chaperone activity
MVTTDTRQGMPDAPRTLEATGLPADLVHQLVIKTLHVTGELSGLDLADRLGVVFSVIAPALELLKRDRHCEISGGSLGPQSYVYRLTEAGHSRAAAFAAHNGYVGKLPVPLAQYRAYMRDFARFSRISIGRQAVRRALAHLVVSDRVVDQLGPAIAARHSLFIYGPSGNGKTVIAQAIGNLLEDEIAIPCAVAVDTEIINVFDPVNHLATSNSSQPGTLAIDRDQDGRWMRCHRPVVTVGGELTMDALELGQSASSGLYRAPLQWLANGGVLIIDDFGRQRLNPRELLNRWIVPLESRTDYLMLKSGQKFDIPFEVLIIFATNLNPLDLVDESFLRRIRYKVHAESPTRDEFCRIFELNCERHGLPFDLELVRDLISSQLEARNIPLRGCHPRDLIEHALSLAEYSGEPRQLTPKLLAEACRTYFLADGIEYPAS